MRPTAQSSELVVGGWGRGFGKSGEWGCACTYPQSAVPNVHLSPLSNAPRRKASGSLKIVHEVYAKNAGLADKLREDLSVAMAHNEQLAQCVGEW